MSIQIEKTKFDGLDAIEILTAKSKLIVVTEIGPRIAHFGTRTGRNLLFWDYPRKFTRGKWQLLGGHRIWASRPLADESEEAYLDENDPCTYKMSKRGVEVYGAVHPVYCIRKSLGIKVLNDNTLEIENRITNESNLLWSGGVWSLTATLEKSTSFYGIPLGREGEWDVFSLVIPKRWGGTEKVKVNDAAIKYTEDCLIFTPKGKTSKRMIQAPQGIIGMTEKSEKISFIKHMPYIEGGRYPYNCNIAFYSGPKNFMTEMENMGPEQTVLPHATIKTKETWMLRAPFDWKKLKGSFRIT